MVGESPRQQWRGLSVCALAKLFFSKPNAYSWLVIPLKGGGLALFLLQQVANLGQQLGLLARGGGCGRCRGLLPLQVH